MEWMLSSETRCQLVAKPTHHELKLLVAGGVDLEIGKKKIEQKFFLFCLPLTATPQKKMPHVCPHVSNTIFASS